MADRSDFIRRPVLMARLALRRGRRAVAAVARDAALRERIVAAGAFAFIFAFLIGSVDYLITGGPDWNPGAAEAAQIAHVRFVTLAPHAPATMGALQAEATALPLERPDYSVAAEPLLGGPDYLTAYEADEARLYRQINAMYERSLETDAAVDPEKPATATDSDLEHLFFGAATAPPPPQR